MVGVPPEGIGPVCDALPRLPEPAHAADLRSLRCPAPRPPRRVALAAVRAHGAPLTIEQIVAVDAPREPRLSPDGRRVAYTAEAAGARQVFILDLRSGLARQVTASEHAVSDPQWSPDGARLAYVREKAIWIVGIDGSRPTIVADHPAGQHAPRWAPDGRRIATASLDNEAKVWEALLQRMPMTAMIRKSSPLRQRASAIPAAAEIEVPLCPTSNTS